MPSDLVQLHEWTPPVLFAILADAIDALNVEEHAIAIEDAHANVAEVVGLVHEVEHNVDGVGVIGWWGARFFESEWRGCGVCFIREWRFLDQCNTSGER